MPLPTLLVAGNLEAVKSPKNDEIIYGPSQNELDSKVPIDYIMNEISRKRGRTSSPADRVLILKSRTGSGKSTILPPEYYHRFFGDDRRGIACTQPRVLTSIDIPETILRFHTKAALAEAGHPGRNPLIMGENIGYQTGVVSKKPIKGITYMTIGVLMQQLNIMSDDDFAAKYSAIFLDEVHERSIDTDEVLFAMKRYIARNYNRKECPFLIIMSATFDVWKFTDYLLSDIKPAATRYENIICVKGSTYPIERNFAAYDCTDYLTAAADKAIEIHEKHEADLLKGASDYIDILIFVGGIGDITKLTMAMNEANSKRPFFKKYPVLPVALTSDVVKARSRDYHNLFSDIAKLYVDVWPDRGTPEHKKNGNKKSRGKNKKGGGPERGDHRKKPTRRVIISTNVGETGITLHTLGYVVDTGWYKSSEFNPNFAVNMLITKPVTQSMATQRIGRAGREAPGTFYAMYTEDTYNAMQVDQFPDIIKDEITPNLLNIIIRETADTSTDDSSWTPKASSILNVMALDLLDMPGADSLQHSLSKLFTLGAIDSNCMPTQIGLIMNRFRFISIENLRTILAGYAWGVSIIDLVNMTSMVDIGRYIGGVGQSRAAAARIFSEHNVNAAVLKSMDDFIGAIFAFDNFTDTLADMINIKAIAAAASKVEGGAEIGDEYGINTASMRAVIERREEVIGMLAAAGFDPYANYKHSLLYDWNETTVKKIKQCIFEGYKLNIAAWNEDARTYVSRSTHISFSINSTLSSLIKDDPPHFILYDRLQCTQNPLTGAYETTASHISTIDGYLDLDVSFDML